MPRVTAIVLLRVGKYNADWLKGLSP